MSGQPACGKCGRFVNPRAPGVAWCRGGEFGEDTSYRCSPCTDKNGIPQSHGNKLTGPWQGRNPATRAALAAARAKEE